MLTLYEDDILFLSVKIALLSTEKTAYSKLFSGLVSCSLNKASLFKSLNFN